MLKQGLNLARTLRHRAGEGVLRSRLRRTDFSIIASNCWGGFAYQELSLEYASPFAGLFVFAPDYLRLLGALKPTLESPLGFLDESRYLGRTPYPLGVLAPDIEIHFVHYPSREEAREKWERRVARIHWERLFVMFTDRDLCTPALLEAFDAMPFAHKVCFTARPYPALASCLYMPEYTHEPYVGERLYWDCKRRFDLVDWLNGGSGRGTLAQRIAYPLFYWSATADARGIAAK